jgi:hypothetical protein
MFRQLNCPIRTRGDMQRREFIGLVGSAAAACPFAVRAQQPAMPVIGFLTTGSFEQSRDCLPAFHQGLAKTGCIEGRNLTIGYRWTDGQTEPLPALAAELVRRRVAAIVTVYTPRSRSKGSDANHSNHYQPRSRSGRIGFGAKPRTSGRQYHGPSLTQQFVD